MGNQIDLTASDSHRLSAYLAAASLAVDAVISYYGGRDFFKTHVS